MRRGRIFIILAIFILLILALAYFFLQGQPSIGSQDAAPTPVMVDIVIAQQNIPQGAVITDDVLGKISLPEGSNFDVMYRSEQQDGQLVGKVAKYPIEQGVVITRAMIGEASDIAVGGPEWASLIPPGMTAISIPTSRLSSVAYGVADGAHVNVVSCFLFIDIDAGFQSKLPNSTAFVSQSGFKPDDAPSLSASVSAGQTSDQAGATQGRVELDPTLQQPIYIVPAEGQRPRPVCQTIFQDVVVLRLGNFPINGAEDQAAQDQTVIEGDPENPAPPTGIPDIVTLIVSPQDATALTYMLYGGAELTLTLRRTDDISRIETEAATLQFLLSQYAIPVPAKLPYAPAERIDSLVAPQLLYGQ